MVLDCMMIDGYGKQKKRPNSERSGDVIHWNPPQGAGDQKKKDNRSNNCLLTKLYFYLCFAKHVSVTLHIGQRVSSIYSCLPPHQEHPSTSDLVHLSSSWMVSGKFFHGLPLPLGTQFMSCLALLWSLILAA